MQLQRWRRRRSLIGFFHLLKKTKIDQTNQSNIQNFQSICRIKREWRIGYDDSETYEFTKGERNGDALVDVNGGDIGEAGGDEVDEEVRGIGGADADEWSGETLKAAPPSADEGAGVAGGFGLDMVEDLDD